MRAHRLLTWLLGKPEEINGGKRCPTYLYRWTIAKARNRLQGGSGIGVYLHHFVADDWSRDFHDHPKRFISIGLWGGCIEQTPVRTKWFQIISGAVMEREYTAPWIRSFGATHVHRLRLRDGKPCWTLVIVLSGRREWGFWTGNRWTPWRTYVNSDRADAAKVCQ